jgi:hypothetical protein
MQIYFIYLHTRLVETSADTIYAVMKRENLHGNTRKNNYAPKKQKITLKYARNNYALIKAVYNNTDIYVRYVNGYEVIF